jgi:hypothetical protein
MSQVVVRSGVAPWLGSQNANGFKITNLGTGSNPGDAVTYAQLLELVADPWALQPIGAFVAYDSGETLTPPPKNKAYRYVLLTAAQTGVGAYNEGILTSETVTGTDPTISATAVVSLVGSPFNGKTIRLINTERRFLRPGVAGTLEDSQNSAHTHPFSATTSTNGAHTHNVTLSLGTGGSRVVGGASTPAGTSTNDISSDGDHNHTVSGTTTSSGGTEARPRSIGVVYYRRIL